MATTAVLVVHPRPLHVLEDADGAVAPSRAIYGAALAADDRRRAAGWGWEWAVCISEADKVSLTQMGGVNQRGKLNVDLYCTATIVFDHLPLATLMKNTCQIDSKHSRASKTMQKTENPGFYCQGPTGFFMGFRI